MDKVQFIGFPEQILRFYNQLAQNNNKEWFLAHKKEYEIYVLYPSRVFVMNMGTKLKKISKKIHAIPRINKSLFRINRDMRFQKNRHPYKTNLEIFFWEGREKKRIENPGFYFHLEKRKLTLSTGIHEFTPKVMKKYREKISNTSTSRELQKVLSKISENDHIIIKGKKLKKHPNGYNINKENKDFLRYKGLYAASVIKMPDILHKPGLIDFCYEKFNQMAPLHKWIVKLLNS